MKSLIIITTLLSTSVFANNADFFAPRPSIPNKVEFTCTFFDGNLIPMTKFVLEGEHIEKDFIISDGVIPQRVANLEGSSGMPNSLYAVVTQKNKSCLLLTPLFSPESIWEKISSAFAIIFGGNPYLISGNCPFCKTMLQVDKRQITGFSQIQCHNCKKVMPFDIN